MRSGLLRTAIAARMRSSNLGCRGAGRVSDNASFGVAFGLVIVSIGGPLRVLWWS